MSMTDPIADLFTRIRNAQMARHRTVDVPMSRIKTSILKIMADEGYLSGFEVLEDTHQGTIRIELKYGPDGKAAISGMTRVSKPSRRVYQGKDEIPKVLNGLGVAIVSTPKGVLTGAACGRQGVGGEILCNIW